MTWEEFLSEVITEFNRSGLGWYLKNKGFIPEVVMYKLLPLTVKWYTSQSNVNSIPENVQEELRQRWNEVNSKLYKVLE